MLRGLPAFFQSMGSRQVIAAILVTAITVALIGIVLVAATPIGCGPANAIGIKSISSRCAKQVAARSPVVPSPSPSLYPSPESPLPSPSESPTPMPSPSPLPTNTQPPDGQPASGAYPPFVPPASAPGAPPTYSVNCRLPIYAAQNGSGGFLVFPGGGFIADPGSAVSLPSPSAGSPTPSPPPQQGLGPAPGFYGLAYDRQFSKWVPVPRNWMSPDGSHYAYPAADGLYSVNVADEAVIQVGAGHFWNIVGLQAAGIYAVQPNAAGLWLLSFSGTVTEVVKTGFWQAVSADAAYGTSTSAVPQGIANTIIRFDFGSGSTVNWFTRANTQSTVIGFDAQGEAIIDVSYVNNSNYGTEVWISTGAGAATPIFGSSSEGLSMGGWPIADSNGVWFPVYNQYVYGNSSQIALYVAGKGLYGMSNITGALAGGCS